MNKTADTSIRRLVVGGFSLVELLVAISIVSILVSLLIPALKRIRVVARQTVCQSQMRQWGLAFESYAASNDGYYPHIDGLDRDAGGADWFGW